MINLLPPDLKENYRYARRNRTLLHWVFGSLAGLTGLVLITGFGFLYMGHSIDFYNRQIQSSTTQLNKQNLAGTEKQVQEISDNLKLVVKVLSHEILFSDLLKQLGAITPQNVVLTGLSITQAQDAVNITAQSTDYQSGTQLQANLADPRNQIFSHADLQNLSCTTVSKTVDPIAAKYPCAVTIRALFASNNPFLFINSQAKP